jgi:esterase
MVHGIFGSGRNWASIARRLVRARPDWGVVLVDLREHGNSSGFPPPHTLRACADDLTRLADALGHTPHALLGHSFGGKVSMTFALQTPALEQLWIVDSTPEARPPAGNAWEMLGIIRNLPDHFSSRDALISELEKGGIAHPVARWMATNLAGDPEAGYRWRFNLPAIEELLGDFYGTDLWAVVEAPPGSVDVHLIKADDSNILSEDAVRRIEEEQAAGRVSLHRVAGGHWVNADNPDALHDLLVQHLPGED